MKESDWKGVAIHPGPESWVTGGNPDDQALTGGDAGRVLSRENCAPWPEGRDFRSADAVELVGRQHPHHRFREVVRGSARSETPYTHRRTAHGNREIPRPTAPRSAARI